jgi:hypothetical protein
MTISSQLSVAVFLFIQHISLPSILTIFILQKCLEQHGFYLDLSYITPNLIASARPSSNQMEKMSKNPLDDMVWIPSQIDPVMRS